MKALKGIGIACGIVLLVLIIFFSATTSGRTMWNRYTHSLNKADEISYETKKEVEDTARSFISSYKTDVDIYHMYCNSESSKKREYAENAKIRAISTANSYNEYLRKNRYVWKDNIPSDLPETLDTNIE